MMCASAVPDFKFIDTILIAYRLGHVRYEEQKAALLTAARAANDEMSFLTALESFGIGRRSKLYHCAEEILAAHAFYQNKYPAMLGLHPDGTEPETFLANIRVQFLSEPILTTKQQATFYNAYWWFVNQHRPLYHDPKKGLQPGIYANEPQDNDAALPRFEKYLMHLVEHPTKSVRQRYDGFPAEILLAILKRAFI